MNKTNKRKADDIAYREYLEKEAPFENSLDDVVKELGFEDEMDFHRLVASIDLSTVEHREAFKDWQFQDGSKTGLLKLRAINNRVFKQNGEWWFWDETDSHMIGPYRSRDEAADKMAEYAAMLNRKSQHEN